MKEDKSKEIEEKAEQLYDYVMRLIKDNHKYSEIKQFLMDDGMDEENAKSIIKNVLLLQKKKGKDLMLVGAVIALLGLLFTLFTYFMASFNHNIYFIAFGPILLGVIIFLIGFSRYR